MLWQGEQRETLLEEHLQQIAGEGRSVAAAEENEHVHVAGDQVDVEGAGHGEAALEVVVGGVGLGVEAGQKVLAGGADQEGDVVAVEHGVAVVGPGHVGEAGVVGEDL